MESTSQILPTVSWSLGCIQLQASCFTVIICECFFFFSQSYLLSLGTPRPCHVSFLKQHWTQYRGSVKLQDPFNICQVGLWAEASVASHFCFTLLWFPIGVSLPQCNALAQTHCNGGWSASLNDGIGPVSWKTWLQFLLINVQFIKHHFSVPTTISGTLSKDTQRESVINHLAGMHEPL